MNVFGGSHHILSKNSVVEILNIQSLPDSKAKRYQVKQVRDIILKYQLAETKEDSPDDTL